MTKMSPLARRLSKMVKTPKRFQRINWFDWVEKEIIPARISKLYRVNVEGRLPDL